MRRPKRRKPKKYLLTDDLPVDEITEAMIEVLGARPDWVRRAKELANAEGLSFDAGLWKAIADGLHDKGLPLPPQLRTHIAEHPDMPEALRRKLLTRDLI